MKKNKRVEFKNCTINQSKKITIKMVKMGMDIDETRNHRIRGIIPTKDGKYLFIEILQGYRPDIKHTSLSKKEYELQYPNSEYIWIDGCFRVDIPKEYYDNYSPEFKDYDRNSFRDLAHTKGNIVKLLQRLNEDIEDIELVDDYYLDKFCDEKRFFRLYDSRLEHENIPIEITSMNDYSIRLKLKYECLNYNKSVLYKEETSTEFRNYDIEKLKQKYGKEKMDRLIEKYNKKMESIFSDLDGKI